MTKNVKGITYQLPEVLLLQESGIGVAEIAARTCYDSFENSENQYIRNFHEEGSTQEANEIEESDLLTSLAWVHHHHSIIEHATLSFLIKGTSRGVLQEHARHRLQAISVRSTRYTMSSVINAFLASYVRYNHVSTKEAKLSFFRTIKELDMFVIIDREYVKIESDTIYDKILFQIMNGLQYTDILSKDAQEIIARWRDLGDNLFQELQKSKKKRNAGDSLKHIVSDNWKVDMVVTFNIRSLKNYFDLRDSGAAWFQIQWLAEAMKEVTPSKYLDLIVKKKRKENE